MELKVGDQVWLEGRNLSITGNKKLSPKRYGPFPITRQIGPVAFQLGLPPSMKIHDVFHVDLLLPYKETEAYGTPFTCPPPIIDNEEEYEIEAILDSRRKVSRTYYFIQVGGMRRGLGVEGDCSRGRGGTGVGRGGQRQGAR